MLPTLLLPASAGLAVAVATKVPVAVYDALASGRKVGEQALREVEISAVAAWTLYRPQTSATNLMCHIQVAVESRNHAWAEHGRQKTTKKEQSTHLIHNLRTRAFAVRPDGDLLSAVRAIRPHSRGDGDDVILRLVRPATCASGETE
jgi:hypothetical protein